MDDNLIYSLYYYKGNVTNNLIKRLSDQHGLIFCKKRTSFNGSEDGHEYYDPVRRKYVTTEKNTRKNIMLSYYRYDSSSDKFVELGFDSKRYSRKFFADNFIGAIKIKDKIKILHRMAKIQKIKWGLI